MEEHTFNIWDKFEIPSKYSSHDWFVLGKIEGTQNYVCCRTTIHGTQSIFPAEIIAAHLKSFYDAKNFKSIPAYRFYKRRNSVPERRYCPCH